MLILETNYLLFDSQPIILLLTQFLSIGIELLTESGDLILGDDKHGVEFFNDFGLGLLDILFLLQLVFLEAFYLFVLNIRFLKHIKY